MLRLKVYEQYKKGNFTVEWTLPYLENYTLGNMYGYSPYYFYWYSEYDEIKNLYFVIQWRKERNLLPCARLVEKIVNDELIVDG